MVKPPPAMPQPIRFDGRVAVVTGAGRGLGRAYAKLLGQLGAAVVVNNRTEALAVEVAAEIVADGGTATADGHSVASDGEKIIEHAVATYGRVDVLINNAGQLRDRSFAKMTWEEWEDVIDTHLHGTFRCTKAACGHHRPITTTTTPQPPWPNEH